MLLPRRRSAPVFIAALLLSSFIFYFTLHNIYQIRNLISYATRPLWDVDEAPQDVISHYHADGMLPDAHLCSLHGWTLRGAASGEDKPEDSVDKQVMVLDAVLMSSELDLLEIRMNELDEVIDYFLIVESNTTFTGLPKDTYFADHRARFMKFEKKIIYRFLPGFPLEPGQTAWNVEAYTRDTMTSLLRSQVAHYSKDTPVVVLMSDIDEIPARHTVALLKACDFGSAVHLQLRNYLYSFEWLIGLSSWRASAHLWKADSYYRHSKSTSFILADAGWHCSYCFRTIPEYVVKMKGFSHSDRIGGRADLLEPKRIQQIICQGKDIFDMLPEAYSYLDLVSQLSLSPSSSAVGLPRYLIENAEKFRFLLPGGCLRGE